MPDRSASATILIGAIVRPRHASARRQENSPNKENCLHEISTFAVREEYREMGLRQPVLIILTACLSQGLPTEADPGSVAADEAISTSEARHEGDGELWTIVEGICFQRGENAVHLRVSVVICLEMVGIQSGEMSDDLSVERTKGGQTGWTGKENEIE